MAVPLMVGTATSGGKPTTPEGKAKKAAAGRQSAVARRAAEIARRANAKGRKRALKAMPLNAKLGDYDKALGVPATWAEAIKREALIEALDGAAKRRGNLVDRRTAEDAAKMVFATFNRLGAGLAISVVQLLGDNLADEVRGQVGRAVTKAWETVLDQAGRDEASIRLRGPDDDR